MTTMSPEQAKGMAEFFLSVIDQEVPTTQKVIRAIPEANRDYKPDLASRSALEIARHLAVGDLFFLEGVAKGAFADWDESAETAITTVADAAAVFDEKWPAALDRVRGLSGEALAKIVSFGGAFQLPAVVYLSFLIRHQVHHRGQLTAYLRAAGGKVPSVYGGSADEPWQPPSE
jgi:uncharacterized damage-inducible protein DinB